MLTKLKAKKDALVAKAKMRISEFAKDEQGDFGVSQIAMIIVAIVIIGMIFLTVQERLPDLFNGFWESITDWFASMDIIT